jgi:hypothetical protein
MNIAKALGGNINFESKADIGSKFTVSIPLIKNDNIPVLYRKRSKFNSSHLRRKSAEFEYLPSS